jgi:hypothetical protein
VHLASDATSASSRLLHTAAVEMANVAAYGALWIIQFVLCDRILFRTPADTPDSDYRHDSSGEITTHVGRGTESERGVVAFVSAERTASEHSSSDM